MVKIIVQLIVEEVIKMVKIIAQLIVEEVIKMVKIIAQLIEVEDKQEMIFTLKSEEDMRIEPRF